MKGVKKGPRELSFCGIKLKANSKTESSLADSPTPEIIIIGDAGVNEKQVSMVRLGVPLPLLAGGTS